MRCLTEFGRYETLSEIGFWDELALAIVCSEEDLPLYRLITAFDAEGRWLNGYYTRDRV